MPSQAPHLPAIATEIWKRKYRFPGGANIAADRSLDDTFHRVARAAAAPEKIARKAKASLANRFYDAMADLVFLPAGRILTGAGTGRNVTLFNCFVLGRIDDDLTSIFDSVKDAAVTMQAGGGIGHDFSTLRPRGAVVASIGAEASGPVSFMDVWDSMCRTIMSAGQRRGAMMATMRCDHPDIEDFIAAKADAAKLRNFNLSVLVTDHFIEAVRKDAPWPLEFDGKIHRTVNARELWERMMRATYDYAEPGVIFIDRINARNNLAYCETIYATNPCGEQPLPPYGACLLGSVNLAKLIDKPFAPGAAIKTAELEESVKTAVRLLDNVIDISHYPLQQQRNEAMAKRRIGLGITGLADALIFCGLTYGSAEATERAANWMSAIQNAAYFASAELAAEKDAFPFFDVEAFLGTPNVARLNSEVRSAIRHHGIRNGCLTSIAPTGTISLLAGNVSSGIEPVFDHAYTRRVLQHDGSAKSEQVEDYAYALYRRTHGSTAPLTSAFVTANELPPRQHLAMQAALQPFVDSAISKTINCPRNISFEAFQSIYLDAYELGLKGCTTYRPNDVTGSVLQTSNPAARAPVISAESNAKTNAAHVQRAQPNAPVVASTHTSAPSIHDKSPVRTSSGITGGIVYIAKPLEREPMLEGATYKLKWPGSAHAIYVTINDIERDGRRRPFEIFISTKNLEHYAWTVALTRMISAVFRRGGDVSFVAEELRAIFDPEGGRWMDGRYVPSLLAAIGDVIAQHMKRTGFMASPESTGDIALRRAGATVSDGDDADSGFQETFVLEEEPDISRHPAHSAAGENMPAGKICPRCGERALVRREGCWTCTSCIYAECN